MKPRARRGQPIRLGRPAELRQQRRRIEDAAAHALGPVALDEPDQAQLVDVGVGGRGRVEQQHAVRARSRRKRLTVNPPAHGAGEAVDRQAAASSCRACASASDSMAPSTRGARPLVSSRPDVLVRGLAFVGTDEIEQRAELAGCRGRLADRPQRLRGRHRRPQRLAGVGARPSTRAGRLSSSDPNAECSTSAVRRSQPPKYFSSRSRASSALTRARTDTSVPESSGNCQCGEPSRSTVDARLAAAMMNEKTTSSAAANGSAASGSESSAWYG